MGVLLLLIVGGLVVSALKHFNGAAASLAQIDPHYGSLCFYSESFANDSACILGPKIWDASNIMPDNKFPGVVLKALFGYRQKLYLVQVMAYLGFLITVGGIYFRSLGGGVASKPESKPVS